MLGFFSPGAMGAGDLLLAAAAATLAAEGLHLAGAVQVNVARQADPRPVMELHVLTGGAVIRISQDLGRDARGCRLDPDGLERTVGLVAAALGYPTDLLIVNKFGKQEAEGGGFRPLIAQALGDGIPVICAVNPMNRDAFLDFTGDFATEIAAEPAAILAWCRQTIDASRLPAES